MEIAICRQLPNVPPSVICFAENTDETLSFLRLVLSGVKGLKSSKFRKVTWIDRKPNKMPSIKGYSDFGAIESFSTAPAVVLAAIYERGKKAAGAVPPVVNFSDWSASAFQTLYEIGFFEIIGHAPAAKIREVYIEKVDSSYKVSKIISGENADGLEEASGIITELLNYLSIDEELAEDLITEINSAVSEAMINVARHAYPEDFTSNSPRICLQKWWMSARANRHENTLTIVVYDQGATIPGTLPRRAWFQESVSTIMRAFIPDFDYGTQQRTVDHEFINYSMKEGKTQTGHARRGLGLPQMQELIDLCPDGTLTILSRQGMYRYAKGTGAFKRPLHVELEGTLIEWELMLPQGAKR